MPYLTQNLPENLTIEVLEVVFLPFAELFRVFSLGVGSRDNRDGSLQHR